MKILIVENFPVEARWGELYENGDKPPLEAAYEAFGSYEDVGTADIVLGTDENGQCHVVKDTTGKINEVRTEML